MEKTEKFDSFLLMNKDTPILECLINTDNSSIINVGGAKQESLSYTRRIP
jgi:hypothetical protein